MNEKRTNTIMPLRSIVESVAGQITSVLNVAVVMRGYLQPEPDGSPIGSRPELCPNVKLSAETTLINACNRLDALLQDSNRWNVTRDDCIEGAARPIIEAEVQLRKTQEQLILLQARPSLALRPVVGQIADSMWVCVYGEIIGSGETPEQAMLAFDKAFKHGVQPSAETQQDTKNASTTGQLDSVGGVNPPGELQPQSRRAPEAPPRKKLGKHPVEAKGAKVSSAAKRKRPARRKARRLPKYDASLPVD